LNGDLMSKVMLIDDDFAVVDLLKTLLDMEGYNVIPFFLEGDIIESIQQNEPDVVLMDVYLQTSPDNELEGLNILSQIREDPKLTGIKVILSSGIDFHLESEKAGADGFLLKPYMPEELLGLIKQVLS